MRLKLPLPAIGLPLLAKELIEQAARRRTYVLRVLYALLLFGAAFVMFYEILDRRSQSAFAVLGRGREMFEALVALQFFGVYLFMPAMTCTTLTVEKERNSLQLLLLTRLGPWTILLEKLLSRLVPMLSFLLLSLPLLAFAYSLGGVSEGYLWGGVWCLAVSALQVGTLGLMCSALFRTTVGAFVSAYIFGFLLFFTLAFLEEMRLIDLRWVAEFLAEVTPDLSPGQPFYWHREYVAFMFFGPYLFFEVARNRQFGELILASLPVLASAGAFLLAARGFIVRRAFAEPRNLLLGLFRGLDRMFWWMNERLARGVVLARDSAALPADEPVAWRETTKRSLGTVRYLFRIFVALETPTAAMCLSIAVATAERQLETASMLLFLLWTIAVLTVCVASASLVAGERSRQTLDVLLTTPLTGREIARQKMRGIWRLCAVLAVPMLTVILMEAWWNAQFSGTAFGYSNFRGPFEVLPYLTCSLLAVGVYLPMVAWLSFIIGCRVRSQTRAIIGSISVLLGWCLAAPLLMAGLAILRGPRGDESGLVWGLLASPLPIIPFNEFYEYAAFWQRTGYYGVPSIDSAWFAWGPILVNFAIYGGCLFALRYFALSRADRLLGRSRPPTVDASVEVARAPGDIGRVIPVAEVIDVGRGLAASAEAGTPHQTES